MFCSLCTFPSASSPASLHNRRLEEQQVIRSGFGCSACSAKQRGNKQFQFPLHNTVATKSPNSRNRRERTNQPMRSTVSGGSSTNLKCIQLTSAPESRFVLLSPGVCRPFCAVLHTSRVSCLLHPCSCYYRYIFRLKLKEHIHTTSIYTELCFICYKISPLRFFFFFASVVSLLPTVYLTQEIDDIKFSLL